MRKTVRRQDLARPFLSRSFAPYESRDSPKTNAVYNTKPERFHRSKSRIKFAALSRTRACCMNLKRAPTLASIGTRSVVISNGGKYYTAESARCELMSTARSSFFLSLPLSVTLVLLIVKYISRTRRSREREIKVSARYQKTRAQRDRLFLSLSADSCTSVCRGLNAF